MTPPQYLSKNIVLKFGGSSVADAAHWQTIANQMQLNLDQSIRPLLVLSALKNVSNLLEALLHQSLAGVHSVAIAQLKELHLGFANQLELDLQLDSKLSLRLNHWFEQLEQDCLNIFKTKSISPKNHAKVLAIGELLSSTIGAEYLSSQGFELKWLDAREVLKSNDQSDPWHHYTSAQCDFRNADYLTNNLSSTELHQNSIIVTQGFIASDQSGDTVLLGREGSDTSAAYFAAMLKAQCLEIWTDVAGVYSSNPREISGTAHLPQLSYQQALLMAQFGAKVLHPGVIEPVKENAIPLNVRSTSKPEHEGTWINSDAVDESAVDGALIKAKAVVFEPIVTHFLFTPPVDGSGMEVIHEKVAKLGFDRVLLCHKAGEYHLISNYVNSDRPHPDFPALFKAFARSSVSAAIGRALITIIADQTDSHWTQQVEILVKALIGDKLIEIYTCESNERVCLLVDSADCLQFSQLIHNRLVNGI